MRKRLDFITNMTSVALICALGLVGCKDKEEGGGGEGKGPDEPAARTGGRAEATRDAPRRRRPGAARRAAAQAGPLAPLVALANTMDQGLAKLLEGKDVAKAFAPLPAQRRGSERRYNKFTRRLKEAGVESGKLLLMEMDLALCKAGKRVYRLRTDVAFVNGVPALLSMRGSSRKGRRKCRANFDKLGGPLAPIAAAARALVKVLEGGGEACEKLPLADVAALQKRVPDDAEDVARGVRKTRESLGLLCSKLGKVDFDAVQVKLDDVLFSAENMTGRPAGTIKAELEDDKDDNYFLEIGRFKGLR